MPRRLVIDRSLVLLLSFLEVFNRESLSDYLHWAFKIVTGEGTPSDNMLLLPHACKSHVMKSGKDYIYKRYMEYMATTFLTPFFGFRKWLQCTI